MPDRPATAATAWFQSEAVIAAGEQVELTFRTIAAFRVDRLALPIGIAHRFVLRDFIVGNKSQLDFGTISCARFAAEIPPEWRRPAPYVAYSQPVAIVGGALVVDDSLTSKLPTWRAVSDLGADFRTETIQTAMDVTLVIALVRDAPPTIFEAFAIGVAALMSAAVDQQRDREVGYVHPTDSWPRTTRKPIESPTEAIATLPAQCPKCGELFRDLHVCLVVN